MKKMNCESKSTMLLQWEDADFQNGTACIVEYSRQLMDQVRKESCGKDVLCREGTWQVAEIITDIADGKTEGQELELIRELLTLIGESGGCEMSATAAAGCLELMERYQDEWELHIRRKRCTNLICKPSYILYIDPQLCDGCEKCADACPIGAIAGGEAMIHVLDSGNCDRCGKCIPVCPKGAVKKIAAGSLKPKLPLAPIPAGTFAGTGGGEEGGMRRRRRGE